MVNRTTSGPRWRLARSARCLMYPLCCAAQGTKPYSLSSCLVTQPHSVWQVSSWMSMHVLERYCCALGADAALAHAIARCKHVQGQAMLSSCTSSMPSDDVHSSSRHACRLSLHKLTCSSQPDTSQAPIAAHMGAGSLLAYACSSRAHQGMGGHLHQEHRAALRDHERGKLWQQVVPPGVHCSQPRGVCGAQEHLGAPTHLHEPLWACGEACFTRK